MEVQQLQESPSTIQIPIRTNIDNYVYKFNSDQAPSHTECVPAFESPSQRAFTIYDLLHLDLMRESSEQMTASADELANIHGKLTTAISARYVENFENIKTQLHTNISAVLERTAQIEALIDLIVSQRLWDLLKTDNNVSHSYVLKTKEVEDTEDVFSQFKLQWILPYDFNYVRRYFERHIDDTIVLMTDGILPTTKNDEENNDESNNDNSIRNYPVHQQSSKHHTIREFSQPNFSHKPITKAEYLRAMLLATISKRLRVIISSMTSLQHPNKLLKQSILHSKQLYRDLAQTTSQYPLIYPNYASMVSQNAFDQRFTSFFLKHTKLRKMTANSPMGGNPLLPSDNNNKLGEPFNTLLQTSILAPLPTAYSFNLPYSKFRYEHAQTADIYNKIIPPQLSSGQNLFGNNTRSNMGPTSSNTMSDDHFDSLSSSSSSSFSTNTTSLPSQSQQNTLFVQNNLDISLFAPAKNSIFETGSESKQIRHLLPNTHAKVRIPTNVIKKGVNGEIEPLNQPPLLKLLIDDALIGKNPSNSKNRGDNEQSDGNKSAILKRLIALNREMTLNNQKKHPSCDGHSDDQQQQQQQTYQNGEGDAMGVSTLTTKTDINFDYNQDHYQTLLTSFTRQQQQRLTMSVLERLKFEMDQYVNGHNSSNNSSSSSLTKSNLDPLSKTVQIVPTNDTTPFSQQSALIKSFLHVAPWSSLPDVYIVYDPASPYDININFLGQLLTVPTQYNAMITPNKNDIAQNNLFSFPSEIATGFKLSTNSVQMTFLEESQLMCEILTLDQQPQLQTLTLPSLLSPSQIYKDAKVPTQLPNSSLNLLFIILHYMMLLTQQQQHNLYYNNNINSLMNKLNLNHSAYQQLFLSNTLNTTAQHTNIPSLTAPTPMTAVMSSATINPSSITQPPNPSPTDSSTLSIADTTATTLTNSAPGASTTDHHITTTSMTTNPNNTTPTAPSTSTATTTATITTPPAFTTPLSPQNLTTNDKIISNELNIALYTQQLSCLFMNDATIAKFQSNAHNLTHSNLGCNDHGVAYSSAISSAELHTTMLETIDTIDYELTSITSQTRLDNHTHPNGGGGHNQLDDDQELNKSPKTRATKFKINKNSKKDDIRKKNVIKLDDFYITNQSNIITNTYNIPTLSASTCPQNIAHPYSHSFLYMIIIFVKDTALMNLIQYKINQFRLLLVAPFNHVQRITSSQVFASACSTIPRVTSSLSHRRVLGATATATAYSTQQFQSQQPPLIKMSIDIDDEFDSVSHARYVAHFFITLFYLHNHRILTQRHKVLTCTVTGGVMSLRYYKADYDAVLKMIRPQQPLPQIMSTPSSQQTEEFFVHSPMDMIHQIYSFLTFFTQVNK